MSTATGESPRIPASLLYWGHLPAGSVPDRPAAQDFRFERVLPVPVERLHTIRAPLPDGGLVLAGIEPERLRSHLSARQDVSPRTWELVPDRLPDHLGQGLDAARTPDVLARLNLLHGAFEPEPRRRLRRRIALVLNSALVLASIVLVVGIERRAARLQEQSQRVAADTSAMIREVVTVPLTERHPELRLTMELRRLEQAALGSSQGGLDPVPTLTALWRAWPTGVRTQIDAVAALQDRLVVRGTAASLADAERIAQGCRTLDPALGLRMQPLQAQANERGAGFLLTFLPAAGATP
jgi:hypothetical protein